MVSSPVPLFLSLLVSVFICLYHSLRFHSLNTNSFLFNVTQSIPLYFILFLISGYILLHSDSPTPFHPPLYLISFLSHSVVLHFILPSHDIRFNSFHSISFHTPPFHSTPFQLIPFHPCPSYIFHSSLFYSIHCILLFQSILFQFILFYYIIPTCILKYTGTCVYSTAHHSIAFFSISLSV